MSARVAIAGYGYIAHYHARAARTAGAQVAAVMGRDEGKARAFAKTHEIPTVYMSAAALADDPSIDAVVICLPNSLHAPLAIQLMEAGKHVLVEKPMAMNEAEAVAMAEASRRHDCRLLVGHMWRFDREALWLREVIARGDLGRIVKTKGYGIHVNWGPSGWFVDPGLAGGGALIDMGVHALDTVRFLLGDPAPRSVYARLGTAFGRYDVDDLGLLVVEWEGGAVSTIESGWWNPWTDGPEASTQLVGTSGYGRLFPTAAHRVVDWSPSPVDAPRFPARAEQCDQHIYDGQMIELLDAISAGRDPVPGPEHGRVIMAICDAAYRSAREGQAIHL